MATKHKIEDIFLMQADIVIAIIFFTSAFNYLFGLIVFVTMVIYLGKKLLQNGRISLTMISSQRPLST